MNYKEITKNLFKKKELTNSSNNSQLSHMNKTYANNSKNSIYLKNPKTANQTIYINNSSNMNSNIKLFNMKNKKKTTNNSPNNLLLKKEKPKNLKYFNKKISNENLLLNSRKKKSKLNPKTSFNNSININKNNGNKILINNKKSNEKVFIGEIFRNKLEKNKIKKSITTKNSINNSINLSYINNKNFQINSSEIIKKGIKFNNYNNGNKLQKIKEKFIYTWEDSKEKIINKNSFTNFMSNSIVLKNINSYRDKDFLKRINALTENNHEDKNNNAYKDKESINNDLYKIKKYVSSLLTNQPQRKQKSHFSNVKKFNTIANEKVVNKLETKRNLISKNEKNSNNKINSNIEINHISKNNKIVNGDHCLFLNKKFHMTTLCKTLNSTKQNSRKESREKNKNYEIMESKKKIIQKKIGLSIRLSNENSINNINKGTNKSISTNNYSYQNSEIFAKSNKKVETDYNFANSNYLLSNKKGIQYNLKSAKKKIFSIKNSKEKIKNNINSQKKIYRDKLFEEIKKNNSNYYTHNCSKDELSYKRNLSYMLKSSRHFLGVKKINVNKNNNAQGIRIKNIKCILDIPKKKNNLNLSNSKNKTYKHTTDKYFDSISKTEINKKNSFIKNRIKEQEKTKKEKLENINEEKNIGNINGKIRQNENKKNKIKKSKNKGNETNGNQAKIKRMPDKDLSDIEEDISLLDYLNNNIDNRLISNSDANIFKDLQDSFQSDTKDISKYATINQSKEIVSNYLKQYYLKHNKYPNTKMNFYKYGRLLGKGAYGKVNLCLHTLTGRLVAIKSINKSKITRERQREKIKIETSIMKTLSYSNNIVKILESYETKNHICIVMEYICAGDLFSYIKKRSKLTETVAKFIFKQIILAIQYIHRNNIVHRDIKLDNILIDLDNNVKICDFGVSKIIKKDDILIDQCGTPTYIAPEILKNKGYEGFPVDVWSAGVVLYAMLNGNVPFKGGDLNELHKLIIAGEYKPIKHISKEAAHLLKCLLEVDPKKRIATDDILFHPWLLDVDLNCFFTQNLFTNAENILLAKSNVDYSDINNKENMVENFDIKNLDTEEDNSNINVKTKSIILAPFNSSLSSNAYENEDYEDEENDFNNPDLIVQNGIIKFSPKTKDLNRNYELNNNQDIDNGIVILSNDSDEKGKKEETPIEGSHNSKINNKHFLPMTNIEFNKKDSKDEVKVYDAINNKILDKVEILGYNKEYIKYCLIKKEFNYATATYRILEKYFQDE